MFLILGFSVTFHTTYARKRTSLQEHLELTSTCIVAPLLTVSRSAAPDCVSGGGSSGLRGLKM